MILVDSWSSQVLCQIIPRKNQNRFRGTLAGIGCTPICELEVYGDDLHRRLSLQRKRVVHCLFSKLDLVEYMYQPISRPAGKHYESLLFHTRMKTSDKT